ncbi:TetR/AcrR family transcriptional regulator [Metabacillus fastidiosus]|uniref:TetR/AcrR family transcriptional regulator n=1 Tax=Metabacillus fastidiosus TaxID=1458 RepID=UPI003D2AD192
MIFNQRGYMTTSMNDIIKETGIQKGGIYRHFKDKDQLMIEAFQFSVQIMQQHFVSMVEPCKNTKEKLNVFVEAFFDLSRNKPIVGGCPIFNAATEMDDLEGNTLIDYIDQAMDELKALLSNIIHKGLQSKELKEVVNPDEASIFIISTLEGALILYKLKKDEQIITSVHHHLNHYFSTIFYERQ